MSVGTLQALGPHRFVGTLVVRNGAGTRGKDKDVRTELRFASLTRWWFQEEEGKRILRQRVNDGAARWSRRSDGKYIPASPGDDALGDLQKSLVFRDRAIAPFLPRIVYEPLPDKEIAGRPCQGFRMALGPPAAPLAGQDGAGARSARAVDRQEMTAFSGETWADLDTGNRLAESWEGRYAVRLRGGTLSEGEVSVSYQEQRTDVGIDPDIPSPLPEEIDAAASSRIADDLPIPTLPRLPKGVPMAR